MLVGNDFKYQLRQMSFRACIFKVLNKAEELISLPNGDSNRTQMLKRTELALELISEFIFNDDGKGYRKKLTFVQEVDVLEMVCDYMRFNDVSGTQASRNAVFVLVFNREERVRVLGGVVSLALSMRCIPVLAAAAILLQQAGPTSPLALGLAIRLVEHHFLLLPSNAPDTLDLPTLSPLFTAHFLTAATAVYGFSEKNENIASPHKHLLEIISRWIEENPTVCISPLMNDLQPVLPQGAIPMPATTPCAGLFRWCILVELSNSENKNMYDQLHLKLLKSLEQAEHVKDRASNVISAQDLASIVSQLIQAINNINTERADKAVEKLSQTLQTAIMSNTLYGPQQDLWRQLNILPENKLLKTILEKNASIV